MSSFSAPPPTTSMGSMSSHFLQQDHSPGGVEAARAGVVGRPRRDFPSSLNLGDGTALATKWGIAVGGRAVLRLEDRIDRSFMEKYE